MSKESQNFLQLFKEKKYSEILFILENEIQEEKITSGLLNLSGVCRMMSGKSNESIKSAINDFRNSFLKETDNYFKTKEKNQINERINFLSSELSSTSSISQRDAISRILQNQLLKKSLVGTNELYKIKIIRDIEISEYPVQPNVLFILALFSIFGFLNYIY